MTNEEFIEISEDLQAISYKVIGLAIEVHRQLGPGLLESTYQECLFYDIKKAGLQVEKEITLPIIYKEIKLNQGYRIDLLVENKLVIELKTVENYTSVHFAQILTYLKLGNYPLGLLINYDSKILKNNIKRFINTTSDS
ncbi:GxxExxY protein [Flavobacterium sp. RSP15]|uniref:GxxExxY protein n=1 Tax=Flavobacterium sp. RSP15 TaxID=2497485 RepID=UPI000F83357A|nr:GxxExxY protein [Flavobacterium sp. RSP15]RTY86862.1 GxxExxY protein [Flavobacterium sp. RSP15]